MWFIIYPWFNVFWTAGLNFIPIVPDYRINKNITKEKNSTSFKNFVKTKFKP